jgi:hypothetical protein
VRTVLLSRYKDGATATNVKLAAVQVSELFVTP